MLSGCIGSSLLVVSILAFLRFSFLTFCRGHMGFSLVGMRIATEKTGGRDVGFRSTCENPRSGEALRFSRLPILHSTLFDSFASELQARTNDQIVVDQRQFLHRGDSFQFERMATSVHPATSSLITVATCSLNQHALDFDGASDPSLPAQVRGRS